ncbi:hypothetical protein ACQ858_08255 [Variovorax ureilyticus]|uniref:hypothetical protein n=1 Tax=Variovorax ureilyticus TaxID=1836198 RepID=UPI003D6766D9
MTQSDFATLRACTAPRTSRDVCRDACAIERPAPKVGGHRWIVPAGIACLITLFFILRSTS